MKPELVLLIEDDDFVATVVERILLRFVPRVLRASNGAEAARFFAENEGKISLVMLDCCLPDVSGVSLCRVFRRLAPTLPVILMSGWENQEARELAEHGPTVFLPKPFLPAQIEEHVTALLGAIA
jgi:two-component system, cell cycle sensor histidine kinase and response regulator CckA